MVAGPPVDLSAFEGQPLTREVLRDATAAVMADITALLARLRDETPPEVPYDLTAARRAAREDSAPPAMPGQQDAQAPAATGEGTATAAGGGTADGGTADGGTGGATAGGATAGGPAASGPADGGTQGGTSRGAMPA